MTRPAPRRRPGFTLVEILVVIVIIGLLVALLVPAVAAAVRAAKNASVQAEINQLAQALADFKSKYGDYPPSRIAVNESGYFLTGSSTVVSGGVKAPTYNDIRLGQLYQRTVTAFRKFWPRVNINTFQPPSTPPWAYDFNGDGKYQGNADFVLQGPECLVFFLGGIPITDPLGNVSVTGFGKSPTNPFTNAIQGNTMYNGNRNAPLFEFKPGRLVGNASSAVINGANPYFPGYLDSLNTPTPTGGPQNFYAYFSTNNGTGYDPNDCNAVSPSGPPQPPAESFPDGTGAWIGLGFAMTQPVFTPAGGPVSPPTTVSPSPNPYTSGPTIGGSSVAYFNPQSFQIISPGLDAVYGTGGLYSPNATEGGLPAQASASMNDTALRSVESDNLTNFHNGKLQ